MRILLNVNSNKQSGLGHITRCLTLADQAWRRGHILSFVGDTNPRQGYISHYPSQPNDGDAFTRAAKSFQPDWTIVDLPGDLPPYVGSVRGKICVIDGLGHSGKIKPDLIISQGFEGEYCAPKYLILRQALERYKGEGVRGRGSGAGRWLVYGGAADELGLLPVFSRVMTSQPAYLLVTEYSKSLFEKVKGHTFVSGEGDASLGWIAGAERAAVHLGMICHELTFFGIPQYIFSRTERHLATALELMARGYSLSWPEVGIPPDDTLRTFLSQDFEPTGEKPDLEGARRVLELMEAG